MISDTLNTNEVKNRAGAEVEFHRLYNEGRKAFFAKISETPSTPHRLTVAHSESGSGFTKRRRSVCRVDLTSISDVDSTSPVTTSCYVVLDAPIGAQSGQTVMADALANLMSFMCTTGAATTVLFDGTGNGASALLTGGL